MQNLCIPKKRLRDFEKISSRVLTSVVYYYFDMSCPNADLIAVSLACPKDPTSPYRMHMGPPTESSVRNLLEKVGNLRDIAVLVQLNLAFLTFIDLHLHSQIVSDYQPLFINGFFEFEIKLFLNANAVPYSQGAPNFDFTI